MFSTYLDRIESEAKKIQNMSKQLTKFKKSISKKLKDTLLKDNQMVKMTLKKHIDQFQQNLNDPDSPPITIEETFHTIEEKHKTEIDISIGMI